MVAFVSFRREPIIRRRLTTRRPVTLTRRLETVGEDGWASRVVTLCWTFANGSVWMWRVVYSKSVWRNTPNGNTVSFSVMATLPTIGLPSQDNIDSGRWVDALDGDDQ